MADLLAQNLGYSLPILQSLDTLFMSKGLINAAPGTVQALLSPVNTAKVNIAGPGRTPLDLYDLNGKLEYYRLFWRTRDCPDDAVVDFESSDDLDFCNEDGSTENRFMEVVINPDDVVEKKVLSITYDYDEHERVAPMMEATEIATRMAEAMENYALQINEWLYSQLCATYTPYTSAGGACDNDNLIGKGRGGWLDLNGGLNAGTPTLEVMESGGAIKPWFSSDLQKLLMVNGFEGFPIVVHGMGGLYDFLNFRNKEVFAVNTTTGLDTAKLAQTNGFYNFLEGRPLANKTVDHNATLIWEPGSHVLLQPNTMGAALQQVTQWDHERRLLMDPRTGLQFHYVREVQKCGRKLQHVHTLFHVYKLVSKPISQNQCLLNGTNQTICIDITRCAPTDCAGDTNWGPLGDPGVTQYDVDVTGFTPVVGADATPIVHDFDIALSAKGLAAIDAVTVYYDNGTTSGSQAAAEDGSTTHYDVTITYATVGTYEMFVRVTFTDGTDPVDVAIADVVIT